MTREKSRGKLKILLRKDGNELCLRCWTGFWTVHHVLLRSRERVQSSDRRKTFSIGKAQWVDRKKFPKQSERKKQKTYWIFITKECQFKWIQWKCSQQCLSFRHKTEVMIRVLLAFCIFTSSHWRGLQFFSSSINLIAFHSLTNNFFSAVTSLMFDYFTSEIIMQKVFPAPA